MKSSETKCWDCCYLGSCKDINYIGCNSFEDFRINNQEVLKLAKVTQNRMNAILLIEDMDECLKVLRTTTKTPRDIYIDIGEKHNKRHFYRKREWKRVIDKEGKLR